MDAEGATLASLGFLKREYVVIERERRWLCRAVPRERILRSEATTDLYVTGTRLRLREARPMGGGAPMLRLSRKVDLDMRRRAITSIYMTEEEFALLASLLPGKKIRKLRHRLHSPPGLTLTVDEFQGALSGLILAEAEFETDEQMDAFVMPDFGLREVTNDARYTGGQLAVNGLPRSEVHAPS